MEKKTILVTGGLGFIGSGIVAELLKRNYFVVIVDFDMNSLSVYDTLVTRYVNKKVNHLHLHVFDLCNYSEFRRLDNYKFDAVIHCAAYKSIALSIDHPMEFYCNNINSTANVLRYCEAKNIKRILFSSTAAVYSPNIWYCYEDSKPNFKSGCGYNVTDSDPYSGSKLICEKLLLEFNKRCNGEAIIFRYFNPIGSYENIRTDISDSLFGNAFRAIENNETFHIFGDCYETLDGTCLRDYVDLRDIVSAHTLVLEKAFVKTDRPIYNLGTGRRLSVLDCCKILRHEVPDFNWDVIEPRKGDSVAGIAECDKIYNDYGWKSMYTVEQTVHEFLHPK